MNLLFFGASVVIVAFVLRFLVALHKELRAGSSGSVAVRFIKSELSAERKKVLVMDHRARAQKSCALGVPADASTGWYFTDVYTPCSSKDRASASLVARSATLLQNM